MQRFKGKVGGIKVQVVDTTGAGDAFCAGLLSNLVKDPGIMEVIVFTVTLNIVCPSTCCRYGANLGPGCEPCRSHFVFFILPHDRNITNFPYRALVN